MDDVVTVEVPDCSCHLSKVERSQAFLTVVPFPDFFEEAAVSGQLEEQIYFGVIAKKAIHLQDVGVI